MTEFDQQMIQRFKSLGKLSYVVLAPLAFALLLTLIPDADLVTASIMIQAFLLLLAIPACVYRIAHRDRYLPFTSPVSRHLLLATLVALPGLILALGWVVEIFEVQPSGQVDPTSVLILLGLSILCAPVAEETFFRAIPSVIASTSLKTAVVAIYGLLFVLMHVSVSNMPAAIVIALMGIMVVIRSASIWVAIVLHALINISVVIFVQTIDLIAPLSQPLWVQMIYGALMVVSLGAGLALAVLGSSAGVPAGLGSGGAPEPQRDRVKEDS